MYSCACTYLQILVAVVSNNRLAREAQAYGRLFCGCNRCCILVIAVLYAISCYMLYLYYTYRDSSALVCDKWYDGTILNIWPQVDTAKGRACFRTRPRKVGAVTSYLIMMSCSSMAEMVNLGTWCLWHSANWIRYSKSIDASENIKTPVITYTHSLSLSDWQATTSPFVVPLQWHL